MSADGPGNREVAHRIFAAEFDDASLSYSESDEERAPNFVVTPTGARVNRLFAVGVLTEVESVNEDTVRGRIVDPTGAFVTYAGQYQPDEHAFLGRTNPPAFVALTGKARTFEPDDSDLVYTSVRPESFNDVDAGTRDRWSVSAAENTLHRIAVFAAALESGLEGDQLRAALENAGVDASLAAGIPRALDHYGTTEAYLEAVRTLAVQTLEQVAGDRDDVDALTADPDDFDAVDLGPLPNVDLDLVVPEGFEAETPATTESPDALDTAASNGDSTDSVESTTPTETTETSEPAETSEPGDTSDASEMTETSASPDVDHAATGEPAADDGVDTEAGADADTPEPAAPETEAGESAEIDAAEEPAQESGIETEPEADDATEAPAASAEETVDAPADEGEPGAADEAADPATDADDDLGDFDADDDFGDADAAEDAGDAADDLGDFDAGGEDEEDALTDEERAEVEAEFDTDFSTGGEVGGPGEADIDVPTSEEDLEQLESDVAGGDSAADTELVQEVESDPEPAADAGDAGDDAGAAADADSDSAADTDAADLSQDDIEAKAVDQMRELDDGDGADREKVVASVVDETGADPEAVEEAIQSALMSGQCYEPGDGMLKAI